jgi:DNA-directed RNA polymerase specialized sigma24 family protein
MPKGQTLTPDQRQTIIEHRLNGVPVRAVAERLEHSSRTVVNVFRDYLEETKEERADEVEQVRQSLVSRHEQAAFTAHECGEAAKREGDKTGHARYLREEREALREIARLTGADRPVQVELSGSVDVNVSVVQQRQLAEYAAELCRSLN